MKKIDLGQTIQILANIGVFGGLVFVGLQLQQDRELAAVDGLATSANDRKYWTELLTNNAEVWVKGINGEPLSEIEQAKFDALAQTYIGQHFFVWARSVRLGESDGDVFIERLARDLVSNPGLLRRWRRERTDPSALSEWDTLVFEKVEELELEQE